MKKFTSLLISCSLALAGAAMAQQPDDQASPKPNQAAEKGKRQAPEAKPEAKPPGRAVEQRRAPDAPAAPKADKAEATTPKPESTGAERHGTKNAPDAAKAPKAETTPKASAPVAPTTKSASEPVASATPAAKSQAEQRQKEMKAPTPAAAAKTSATPATAAATATPAAKMTSTPAATATVAATSATPATTAGATPAASVAPAAGMASEKNAQVSPAAASATPAATSSSAAAAIPTPKPNTAAATKKPDQQKMQQIKTEHANFRAQPRPEQVPAVTFNQNYRVEGSDRWQGRQYEAFRSYRPERHDESYYRSHYGRVELIGGGYYYQNNNYWYPAWGYNPRDEYYAYDGPIYVGRRSEPPDRVIADVQAALQQMGYYTGEVDGLLGPLTRKALIGYQEDAGLTATAAIDEPTLDTLNLGS